eukprot:15364562-Ditylum_brightwellii.AAC.1
MFGITLVFKGGRQPKLRGEQHASKERGGRGGQGQPQHGSSNERGGVGGIDALNLETRSNGATTTVKRRGIEFRDKKQWDNNDSEKDSLPS